MSKKSEKKALDQLTLFAGDSPVKTCRWRESAMDWVESDQDSGSSLHELLLNSNRLGLSLKMYRDCSRQTKEKILPSSFDGWGNAGIMRPGVFLTVSIGESHNAEDVCLLSEVLETQVASKYYLSPKACRGILRRAEKRGKELPEQLKIALEMVANMPLVEKSAEPSQVNGTKEAGGQAETSVQT